MRIGKGKVGRGVDWSLLLISVSGIGKTESVQYVKAHGESFQRHAVIEEVLDLEVESHRSSWLWESPDFSCGRVGISSMPAPQVLPCHVSGLSSVRGHYDLDSQRLWKCKGQGVGKFRNNVIVSGTYLGIT